ncbi:hypothetical protein HYALB_00010886, partial [Hymenoscyphus albidus]
MVPKIRPSVAEILNHDAYPDTTWELTPTKSGRFPAAEGRDGPVMIDWEVHGEGDVKLVWIMGLGTIKTAWQRQTKEFGHDQGDKYSSLIFDNRGMGKSDKPLCRYSTSQMAQDLVDLLNHLGWTSPRSLDVSGVSMGGMIAQELALLIPERINSLNLISTAAAIENTTTWLENVWARANMFIPKSLDETLKDAALRLFRDEWLDAPDDTVVPTSTTPGAVLPLSGSYAIFATNYERFCAQELEKRARKGEFTKLGFVLQAIAAGWHHKSAAQLKELGDRVGRERICVMHGTRDNMIDVTLGRKLIGMLNPGRVEIVEGRGHVFMLEEWRWHNNVVREGVERGVRLNERGV